VDDRPELKYINRHVKDKVCTAGPEVWLHLGTDLLDEKDVEALYIIKSDSTECGTCCSEMFKLWLERKPGASWKQLVVAMKRIHLNKLASDVENLLLIEQTRKEGTTIDQQTLQDGQLTLGQNLFQRSHNSMFNHGQEFVI